MHLYSYICKEDMVTNILKPDWGFTRYGITKSFSILDYLIEFKEVNGYDFPSSDNLDLATLINSICNGREEIYQISDAFTVVSSDSVHKDNIQEYIDSNLSPLTGKYEVLKNFVECEQTPNEDDTVKIKIKTCPGFLITLFGIIISEVKENTSTGSILLELIGLMKYLNCFMNIMGISIADFRNISTDYFLVCHSYPSYLTYINSL